MSQRRAAEFRRDGEKRTIKVLDSDCIYSICWEPVFLLDSSAKQYGTCRHRLTHGCPDIHERGLDANLGTRRAKEGWRLA